MKTRSEWESWQNQPTVNTGKFSSSKIKIGDLVYITPDRSFCSGGNEKVTEITETEIITSDGSRWDKKTGRANNEPWAYHL